MKRALLLLIGLVAMLIVKAEAIDRNAALLKAQRFMPDRQFIVSPASSARLKALRNNAPFYIFNATNDEGFVIVSGDDRTTEILGYGEHGNLNLEAMPENLAWWLEGYIREIESMDAAPASNSKPVSKVPTTAIAPLTTAKWNQTAPYDNRCPDGNYVDFDETGYNAGNRCFTGCVAVAMAQLMHYWKWPESCGALDSYEAYGHPIKALPATTFKWDLMQDTYSRTATGAAVDAVAELMRYCGQAIQMQYSTTNSSAHVSEKQMIEHFQYSPNCYWLMRDNYTASRWATVVYEELAAQRPVLYRGDSETSAHIFIVDGYDGSGLFHINWGWGGLYDGFFALSALSPGTHGTYAYNQYAMIGLQPAQEGEQMLPVMQCSVSESSDTYLHSRSETYDLEGSVVAQYNLEPASTLKAEIGWALYQNGTFVKVVSSKTVTISKKQQDHFLNSPRVSFDASLPSGTYWLCQIYRFEDDAGWQLCHPYLTYPYMLVLELTDTYFYVRLFDVVVDTIYTPAVQPASNGTWYNLQGLQVAQPRKGVYIKAGRKILLK